MNEIGELEERLSNLDKRIVEGYLFAWGKRNLHGEKLLKGSCAKSIREHGPGSGSKYEIKFLNQHDPKDPLSLFEVLKEDDYGLYFKTKVLDEVESADRVLTQLRSGTLGNFSGGFNPVWSEAYYDETDDSIVYPQIMLMEGSVVSIPSDLETYHIRSMEDVDELDEQVESFISTLPRSFRLQARHLFAAQKALIDFEPLSLEQRKAALKGEKPPVSVKSKLDVEYIVSKLKNH